MRIAFLGLGLIGGSVARALRAGAGGPLADATITAWTPGGSGPAAAGQLGVVDVVASSIGDAIRDAGLIVLAAPPTAVLLLLDDLAGPSRSALSPDAVVTDVASTKGQIVERAAGHGLRFVGGHPMAGLERAGFGASTADLFRDRPWVVCGRPDDPGATDLVTELARAVGARPVAMTPAAHDAAVAAISHLPLVAAAALVESVTGAPGSAVPDAWPDAARLAASGWRDMTRLARGDVAMGAGIATTNAAELARRLRDYRSVLDAWIADLERAGGPSEERLADRFRSARERLEPDPG